LKIPFFISSRESNKDKHLKKYEYKEDFFDKIRLYKDYGDTIAQHGTFHNYTSNSSGILGINSNSEFAGHSYKYQYELIKKGKEILNKNSCWQPIFMAPAHSFDENTLKSLKRLNFKSITDGYGFYPIKKEGIDHVPQLSAKPFNVGFGLATICLHTNSLSKKDANKFINFIKNNRSRIISYQDYKNFKTPPKYILKPLNFFSWGAISSIRKFKKVFKDNNFM